MSNSPQLPQVITSIFNGIYGEVIPLSNEEQVLLIQNLHQILTNQPLTPPLTVDLPTFLQAIQLQNPFDKNDEPVVLPTISVPRSPLCFFKSEYAKRKAIKRKQGEPDPHAALWNSLTSDQRENWTHLFQFRRDTAEKLIRDGFFRRAPSDNEIRKARRMEKLQKKKNIG
uniref:HMG box domain-containing protein n=1 Tax=Caenorhabditis tropicalis TaxID=1561998 RepID=A0A1I7V3C4_9PELO